RRPAVGGAYQRRIGREQGREEHHVREDEEPETVGDDDALGLGTAVAEAGVLRPAVGQADGCCLARHACCSINVLRSSARIRRRSRAFVLTSSTGMICSFSSRQAYQTNIAKAPIRPRIASHQMYQITAKPQSEAKKATMTPVGVFTGISIGW